MPISRAIFAFFSLASIRALRSAICVGDNAGSPDVWVPVSRGNWRNRALQPVPATKAHVETDTDGNDKSQDDGIAKWMRQFGHVLKVHAIDAGDHRRYGDNGYPGRDLPHIFVLPHTHMREIGLKNTGQEIPKGVDLLVDAQQVIVHVTKIGTDIRAHVR